MEQPRVFDRLLTLVAIIGVLVAAAAVVAMATNPPAAEAQSDGSSTESPQTGPVEATISLSEWAIGGDLEIPAGDVRINLVNDGTMIHNLEIVGVGRSPDVNGGQTVAWDVGELEPGTYEVICAIAGHEAAGMVATLVVGDGSGGGDDDHTAHGGHSEDWATADQMMIDSILAFPAATEGIGNVPLEPTVLDDGTLEFELTASIVDWEVEPGKIVQAWAYNGIVPGPHIKVDVGDRVRVIFNNDLPASSDIHWHGVSTPNNMDGVAPLTQPAVAPGETFVYEFVAEKPAVGMYHAHMHGQMQVPNGLFAALTIGDVPLPSGMTVSGVEIPDDLEIALEIPMVLNDAGVIGLSLNGKSFPATEPYVVTEGDWIMAHYYNEGLQSHPMHQHQFPQLVIAKDGVPLDHPYWADTVNVAPGERYTVIFHADRAGVWVWHCHILNHVESSEGMFGMVTAVIVEPAA